MIFYEQTNILIRYEGNIFFMFFVKKNVNNQKSNIINLFVHSLNNSNGL